MTRNVTTAEDLTQDVFLQVHRKLQTFRSESTFSTWLHRVVVNIVLMQLRVKAPVETPLEEWPPLFGWRLAAPSVTARVSDWRPGSAWLHRSHHSGEGDRRTAPRLSHGIHPSRRARLRTQRDCRYSRLLDGNDQITAPQGAYEAALLAEPGSSRSSSEHFPEARCGTIQKVAHKPSSLASSV